MACDPFLDGCISREMPEGSCANAVAVAQRVIQLSVTHLEPFFCPGLACGGFTTFVSHGPPAVMECNFVASWIEGLNVQGPNAADGGKNFYGSSVLRAQIRNQLWVGCFPQGELVEGQFYYPDMNVVGAASVIAATIGETWYLKVATDLLASGELATNGMAIGQLFPLEPAGGCVGWEFPVSVTL